MSDLILSAESMHARISYAKALASSNMLPPSYARKPENILIAIEYGAAFNIPPVTVLNEITVINGRPSMSADLMASLVRKAGHRLRIRESGQSVTAELIRRDDPDFTFTVTWDQQKAVQAGLWGRKGPWSEYPLQMLRSRAITEVCRQGASDVLFGVRYTPDELEGAQDGPAHAQSAPVPVVQSRPAQPHVEQVEPVEVVAEVIEDVEPQPAETAPASEPVAASAAPEASDARFITSEQETHLKEWAEVLAFSKKDLGNLTHWASRGRTRYWRELYAEEAGRLLVECARESERREKERIGGLS
ncbi:hypothetical protein [Schaalia sp. lx-100]|uniref:hypothetical protein n=1 Tax=Schaalia sp. lx-100 TaxID=2899081 RepID=UPI001E3CECE5|nr:hypothetical protein [Schaalia sp. lx-100]MCD4557632.1 hypothetical protein [Schaalia sp. lx-100]